MPFWIRRPDPNGPSAAPPDVSDPSTAVVASSAPSAVPGHDLLIVPLASWYHSSWDQESGAPGDDTSESAINAFWADMRYCSWPEAYGPSAGTDENLARHFADMNKVTLSRLLKVLPPRLEGRAPPARRLDKGETYACFGETPNPTDLWSEGKPDQYFTKRHADAYEAEQKRRAAEVARRSGRAGARGAAQASARARTYVVSLSHFVPRQELLPEKRTLFTPMLHRVCGSAPLEQQLRQLMPDLQCATIPTDHPTKADHRQCFAWHR
jgi:hypothetical protein